MSRFLDWLRSNFSTGRYGPLLYVETSRGLSTVERIADQRVGWLYRLGALIVLLTFLATLFWLGLVVTSATHTLPIDILLPDTTHSIPIFLCVLTVSLMLHEMGHAFAAATLDIPIESWGVGFAPPVFLLGFVQFDDDILQERSLFHRIIMIAGGPLHSLLLTVIGAAMLVLLTGGVEAPWIAFLSNPAVFGGYGAAAQVAIYIFWMNLVITVSNLVPLPLVDGGKLAASLVTLSSRIPYQRARRLTPILVATIVATTLIGALLV